MRPALFALATLMVTTVALAQTAGPAARSPATSPATPATAPPTTPATTPPAAPPATPPATERATLQSKFRELYAAGKYAEALPIATQLVDLADKDEGLRRDLPTLLVNLGIVQFRLGDYPGAEKSFTRALDIVQASQGISSRKLVPPLTGLGRTYAAQAQYGRAAEVLNRALNINRRADGLFNIEQLPIIDALVDACVKTGDVATADRERLYSLQVVEHRYGALDPRTVPVLTKVAQWYEQTRRYASARVLYERKYQIGSQEAGGRNEATVSALIGIARTHRLQFVLDPQSLLPDTTTVDQMTGRINASNIDRLIHNQTTVRLNPDGERALMQALKILDESPKAPTQLRGWTLVELGDWMMTAQRPDKGLARYAEAFPLFPATLTTPDGNPLLQPRLLVYTAPEGTERNAEKPRSEVELKSVEFVYTVTPRGTVSDLKVVRSEVSDSRLGRARSAIAAAIYSPRYVSGEAVETKDVHFREGWLEVIKPSGDEAAPSAQPAEDKPADKSADKK
jgi:tetratricopeptide (TPR) repeat protein